MCITCVICVSGKATLWLCGTLTRVNPDNNSGEILIDKTQPGGVGNDHGGLRISLLDLSTKHLKPRSNGNSPYSLRKANKKRNVSIVPCSCVDCMYADCLSCLCTSQPPVAACAGVARKFSWLDLDKKSDIRQYHEQTCQPFSGYAFEHGVVVAPSNVHGLGLFTTKPFSDGTQVCLYSGECVKCIDGNKSNYLLETKWYNRQKRMHEKWHIDSAERNNRVWTTAARYINDPCSTYTVSDYAQNKVPGAYRTNYSVTCRYGTVVSEVQHAQIGQYTVPVLADGDLPAGVELLAEYGTPYWERYIRYFKGHDPNILCNRTYDDSAWLKNRV